MPTDLATPSAVDLVALDALFYGAAAVVGLLFVLRLYLALSR